MRKQYLRRFALALFILVGTIVPPFATLAASASSSKAITPEELIPASKSGTFYLQASGPCAQGSCLRLYRTRDDVSKTTDAPNTFVRVAMPQNQHHGTSYGKLPSVAFASATIGYALVGSGNRSKVFTTNNGAETWQRVTTPSGYETVALASNGTTLYAAFAKCTHGQRCTQIQLARRRFDSKKWDRVTIPFATSVNSGHGGVYGSLAAAQGDVWFDEETSKATVLYTSSNAGKTYVRSTPSALGAIFACAFTPEGEQRLWAECPTGMQVSFPYSSNAGKTWSFPVKGQFFGTGGGGFSPAGGNFAYVDFGDTLHSLNVDRVNVGADETHAIGRLSCNSVDSFLFVGPSHGYAICNDKSIDRSVNGGVSWQKISLPKTK